MANRLIKPRKFRSSKELKKDSKLPKSDSKGKSSRTAGNRARASVVAAPLPQPGRHAFPERVLKPRIPRAI